MNGERERLDWDRVRERLRQNAAALDAASEVSAERLAAVYRARAAALAVRHTAGAATRAAGPRVLVFELAGERYGLDFGAAAEVLAFAGCTPVPGGPPELLGVVNVRGDIRSVLDLGRLIGLPAGEARGYVLIARAGGESAAFRVDRVEAARPLVGAVATDAVTPFVRGMTSDRVRLLDLAAVFAHPVLRPASAPLAGPQGDGGSPP